MPTFHRDDVEPSAIHPAAFVGSTDPATVPANNVAANKLWIDTASATFKIKKRNAGNTAWDTVASLTHSDLTGLTTGDPHTQYLLKSLATTKGDILVATGAGVWVRVGAGSDGYVLTADAGATEGVLWASPASLSGHTIQDVTSDMTSRGKLAFVGATLTDDSGGDRTVVTIAAPGMTNPMTTLDDIIIGGASGAAARLAKGTDGQVLTVDPSTHHLVWASPTTGFANPMTTQDDLIVGGAAGAGARLPKGSDTQVLTIDPSTHHIVWATPATPGTGTVTSVAFTAAPSGIFDVSGSPITGSGTIALSMDNQTGNVVLASPSGGGSGAPAFRSLVAADLPINGKRITVAVQFGDGTNAIDSATERDQWLECNFDGTIEGYSLLADASGTMVVDIWKDTYTNYPPVVGDSITASAKPTISSGSKTQDSTLTGWTTAITRGDVLKFHVDSSTTIKAATLSLRIAKT